MGINDDMERIDRNIKKAEKKIEDIENRSIAYDVCSFLKKVIITLTTIMFFLIIICVIESVAIIYLINSTTTVKTVDSSETNYSMENENGINTFVGGDNIGEINNNKKEENQNH